MERGKGIEQYDRIDSASAPYEKRRKKKRTTEDRGGRWWQNEGSVTSGSRERDQIEGMVVLKENERTNGQAAKAEEEEEEEEEDREAEKERSRAMKVTHRSSCWRCLRRAPPMYRACGRAASRAR